MLCIIMLFSGCGRQDGQLSYYQIAYNYAQELGYDGSLQDFINLLKAESGRGIQSIALSENGELEISYTDGVTVNLGRIKGEDGKDGIDGQNGKDGRGVLNIELNEYGELEITYTDGVTVNLGRVKGEDGKDGLNGRDGIDGQDGQDGIKGKDGRGIADIILTENGDLRFLLTDGGVITAGNIARHLCQNIWHLDFYPLEDGSKFGVKAGKAIYLSEIVLPQEYLFMPVTEILENGFNRCAYLKSVIIPQTVEKIGDNAFSDCHSLSNVTICAETPPLLGKHAFHKTPAKIFVPDAESYKNAPGWAEYSDRIYSL